ncbi:hypothetical protein [Kocuria sp. KH4]
MSSFGYKIATFAVTPNYRPDDRLTFDSPDFGGEGIIGWLENFLTNMCAANGDADERRSDFLKVRRVQRAGWCLVVDVRGGSYGDDLTIVDSTTGADRGRVEATDALLREGRVVMVVPEYGTQGLIVTEVKSNKHHLVPFSNRLSRLMRDETGKVLRVGHEVADSVAWAKLFERGEAQVSELIFTSNNPAERRHRLPGDEAASKLQLVLSIARGTRTQERISRRILESARRNRSVGLLEAVGRADFNDDDFDTVSATVVEDGAGRKISIGESLPRFVYMLDTEDRLSLNEFLDETREAAEDTLRELDIDLARDWWARGLED